MCLSGLNINGDACRYGFNGQEKDDEVAGEGNSNTAQFWQYDARVAKRWNRDPVVKEHESPYAVFANNPLWFVDPLGADTIFYHGKSSFDEDAQMFLADEEIELRIEADGEDVHLFLDEEGNFDYEGNKYIEVWSRYSISGVDWMKDQTSGVKDNLAQSWLVDYFDDLGVLEWDVGDVDDEVAGGALDLSYNDALMRRMEDDYGVKDSFKAINGLYLINGKYANANEFGNYAISSARAIAGGYLWVVKTKAHGWGIVTGTGLDDEHEQTMLEQGYADAEWIKSMLLIYEEWKSK